MGAVVANLYDRLLREDLGWTELMRRFDSKGTGKVSAADFRRQLVEGEGDKNGMLSEDQTSQVLRCIAAYSSSKSKPINLASVDVSELFYRLEILYTGYQRTVDANSRLSARCPSSLCASVLKNIGRVLLDRHGDLHGANLSFQHLFATADTDLSGKLNRDEFRNAVRAIVTAHPQIVQEISGVNRYSGLDAGFVDEMFDFADISGDGTINYLEFLHCLKPDVVDGPGADLRTCLMEQIATTIYMNKGALLKTFSFFDEPLTPQRVTKATFLQVISSLNTSLSVESPPMTDDQIEILVDHVPFDGDLVNYVEFLDCFQIIDSMDDIETV